MAWTVTEGNGNEYADVHSNSGEFTYRIEDGNLCGGVPDKCSRYTSYSVTAFLDNDERFPSYSADTYPIAKTFTAKSCNQDMLVMWFNQGDNKSYDSVLDNNTIFDIKNVDDCEHIVIALDADGMNTNSLRTGGQKFDDSGYTDSGYPYILNDPNNANSSQKYVAGVKYNGHKIKYHTINNIIPDDFYKNHSELVELYFPHMYSSANTKDGQNITIIGTNAFQRCSNLSAITLGSVETIGFNAFANCQNLKIIDWGHSGCEYNSETKTIGTQAFSYCTSLSSVTIPNTVITIGASAFLYCRNLTNCTIGSGVTSISANAFSFCTSLSSVTIGENVKDIGANAFNNCSALTSISIPNSVKTIGNLAFYNCTNLASVTVYATEPPTLGSDVFNGNAGGRMIYVPKGSGERYKTAPNWSAYEDYISEIPTELNT